VITGNPISISRTLARVGALVLLLAVASCDGDQTPQLPPLKQNALVLAYGDSITVGVGASAGSSYPEVLSQLIGHRVVRSGVSGEVSEAGLRRLPSVISQYQPDLIILCHGGNDILRGVPERVIEANLRAMISLARAAGAHVVLVGVPKRSVFMSGGAPLYERIADELDLPYLDSTIAEIMKSNQLKSDAVHPNAAGYRKIAEEVAELLRRAGVI